MRRAVRGARRSFDAWYQITADLDLAAERAGISSRTARRWLRRPPVGEPIPSLARARGHTSPLVGRSAELRALDDILTRGRLAVLLGPAGVGKTRLALEYATLRARLGLPVVVVDLEPASDREGVLRQVEEGLGVAASMDPVVHIGRVLAARSPCVVVLDSVDHVAFATVPLLEAWRVAAPDIAWILASRVKIGAEREVLVEVAPLAVPPEGTPWPRARAAPAVKLLLWRAPRLQHLSRDRGEAVSTLARRLEGFPLALEIGGARLADRDPETVLAELEADAAWAADTGRTGRHGSMEAAIAWSFDRLAAPLADALLQLSVFAGGFTLDSAREVLDLSAHPDAPGADGVVRQLADASFLRRHEEDDGERWFLFASVRELARRRRAARDGVEDRHARHFAGRCRGRVEERPRTPGEARALARDVENLLAAYRHALGKEDPELALDLALALDALLVIRGKASEQVDLLDRALDLAARRGAPARLVATALIARGRARVNHDRLAEAERDLVEALRRADEAGDRRVLGRASMHLGRVRLLGSDPAAAAEHLAQAITAQRDVGDAYGEGVSLSLLAVLACWRGDLDQARSLFEAALVVQRAVGDRLGMAENMRNLAELLHAPMTQDTARAFYRSALDAFRAFGSRRLEAMTLGNLGILEQESGRARLAADHYLAALAIFREVGARLLEGVYLGSLATLRHEQRRLDEARELYRQAIAVLGAAGDQRYVRLMDGFLAVCEAQSGELGAARRRLRTAIEGASALGDHVLDEALALCDAAVGVVDEGQAAAFALRARVASAASRPAVTEIRLLVRCVRAALGPRATRETPPSPAGATGTLRVSADGRLARTPGGVPIDLGRRPVLRRLLARLVEERRLAPGRPVTLDVLLACGWPGEKILPDAARNRAHVALNTLRELGLRELLERVEGGYRLDPHVPLEVEATDEWPMLTGARR